MITETLTNNALWFLGFIYILLIIASLIAVLLKKFHQKNDYTSLIPRIRSWWMMVIIFTIAISLYKNWAIIFLAFVSFLSLKEYLSLIPTRREDRRVLFLCYLLIPLQYYFVAKAWYGMFIILVPVYGFIAISIATVLTGKTKNFLQAVSTLHWGVMITIFSVSHLAYLLALPQENYPNMSGASLLMYIVFTTQFNDVSQYVWGNLFGQHKVIPSISPNKTWEGLVGGILTSAILSLFLGPYLTPLNGLESFFMGGAIGLSGFLGDITISAVKRDLQIKDTGTLLPGHGGILDRMDSLFITAPLFFHVLYFLKY
jgi:phosphatidate cytidylyltransferase